MRGSWTVTVGQQDRTPANRETTARDGGGLTSAEETQFKTGIDAMTSLKLGQIVWINNAMPYVLRIEFDGHSSVKAPAGMVQISINEIKTWLKTVNKQMLNRGAKL